MTHAWTHPQQPDPIYRAILAHRDATTAYEARPSLVTNEDLDAATDALIATACSTRFGALVLLTHLRTWLADTADYSAGHQPAYRIAEARVADLTLFLGTNLPPVPIPRAFPSGRLPAMPVLHLPAPQPTPLHLRVIRGMGAASELISAVAIIGTGAWVVGLASIL